MHRSSAVQREWGSDPTTQSRRVVDHVVQCIRIAVLDDHPAVLGGLQRLAGAPDLEPVAAMLLAHTPHDAIAETLDVRRDEVAWRARRRR
jgi:hypothetical protein